uniref:Putative secreted protein n=1 Tax=Rhipicephalus microplus TaxID=6941 RepID=A0A6G5A5B3_RHIMP
MPTASVQLFLALLWSFRIVLTYKRQERLPFYVRVIETHTKKTTSIYLNLVSASTPRKPLRCWHIFLRRMRE